MRFVSLKAAFLAVLFLSLSTTTPAQAITATTTAGSSGEVALADTCGGLSQQASSFEGGMSRASEDPLFSEDRGGQEESTDSGGPYRYWSASWCQYCTKIENEVTDIDDHATKTDFDNPPAGVTKPKCPPAITDKDGNTVASGYTDVKAWFDNQPDPDDG